MMKMSSPSVRRAVRIGLLPVSSVGLWTSITFGSAQAFQAEPIPTPDQVTFFETKIRPVLVDSCIPCHGADSQSGGLRLDSRASMMKGGKSGPALVPNDPDKSLIIISVHQNTALKMPAGGRLKPAQVADLEAWVKMGAPWPQSGVKPVEKKPLWSLQPIRKPAIPKVSNVKWVRNPIDAFILERLDQSKLTPANQADARTLLRRVTYDLAGLPPTPEEVDAFITDKSPEAYEKVIDRLLASPQYGERWARLWLDVARYSDTKGYVFEEDRNYPNAYTYRDWVINAFNQDLPYNQFITQQLAADRLPSVQSGDDKRPLAALGFLTVGRRFLNSAPDIIDDRIDVTMRGLQGFTVSCARCHDHKFDPVPTQDYYSLYGVFNSSSDQEAPISEKSIREPWAEYAKKVAASENKIREVIASQTSSLIEKSKQANARQTLNQTVLDTLQTVRQGEIPTGDKLNKLRSSFDPQEQVKLSSLEKELVELRRSAPTQPEFAMALTDSNNPGDVRVFKRGNPGNQGDIAPRRFLSALSSPSSERELWKAGSGRLQLAEAIASEKNPLTARVMVNRVWMNYFGNGIVRTTSDFGFQGDKPTHPELLDYLASTFMENGWSIKRLHKLIVMSATYRQSSTSTPAAQTADPDNRLLSHMSRRRLDLEQMRDSVLSASSRLDRKSVGGRSVNLWVQPFTPRRSVYGFIERQNLPGIFRTFDFASPDSTSPRRFQTTVPQQALFFMNSPFMVEQAKALVTRPEVANAKDESSRIKSLYRLLFGRTPDAFELNAGATYLKSNDFAPVSVPTNAWSYGFGGYDTEKRLTSKFTPLAVFDGTGYHVSNAFPDSKLGYLVLNPFGGHPGNDSEHAIIRRWTAPEAGNYMIEGQLSHKQAQGDGVRARIVSNRGGLLGEWISHQNSVATTISGTPFQKGDTIDFIIDPISSPAFDSFEWSPLVRATDSGKTWDSRKDFGPPPPTALNRITLYAQALMMTNEFMFID